MKNGTLCQFSLIIALRKHVAFLFVLVAFALITESVIAHEGSNVSRHRPVDSTASRQPQSKNQINSQIKNRSASPFANQLSNQLSNQSGHQSSNWPKNQSKGLSANWLSAGPYNVVSKGNESYVNVRVSGQNYFLWQRRNQQGKVTAQTMISKDRKELAVDKNNDGSIDHWEMSTPNSSIRMFNPRRGQFLFMDVEHRLRPDAGIVLKYSLDYKTGQYVAYGFQPRTYKKLSYQDFVVGCKSDESNLQELSKQLVEWTKKDENASLLRFNIKNNLLDDSCKCMGPGNPCKSDFASALPGIVDGIMKIVQSDNPSIQPGDQNNKGEFLQCLRYLNLGVHAARISSGLAQFAEGENGLSKKSWFSLQVRCEMNSSEYGSFDNSRFDSIPTVAFHKNASTLAIALANRRPDPIKDAGPKDLEHSYAETFFHEMLHYSRIEDDKVVDAIVECCKNPDNVRSEECKFATDMVHTREAAQKLQAVTAELEPESWRDFRNGMVHEYGLHANPVIDDLFNEAGKKFNSVADQEKCKKATTETAKKQCNDEFRENMQGLMSEYFTGSNAKCGAYAQGTKKIESKTAAGKSYEATATDFLQSVPVEAMSERTANDFCMKLQGLMLKLYNLPTDQVTSMMVCKGAALPIDNQNLFYAWLIRSWLGSEVAHAAEASASVNETGSKLLCSAVEKIKHGVDFSDIQWSPIETSPPPATLPMIDTPGQMDDSSGTAGRTGKIGPSPGVGSGEVIRPSPYEPSRPIYGQTNTDRVRQIEDHLRRGDGVVERTRAAAREIGNVILPQARAADSISNQIQGLSRGLQPDSSSSKISLAQVQRVQLSQGGIPNPFDRSARGLASTSKKGGAMAGGGGDGDKRSAAAAAGRSTSASRKKSGRGEGDGAGSVGEDGSGGGASASAANGAADRKPRDGSLEELSKDEVIRSLLRPYRMVRPDLARPVVVAALLKYHIRVIDHEGRIHGERASEKREPGSLEKHSEKKSEKQADLQVGNRSDRQTETQIEFIYDRKVDRLVRSP